MNTETLRLDRQAAPGARLRRLWSLVAVFLLAGVFLEAIFAGAALSGFAWALPAHRTLAALLIAGSFGAAVFAFVSLRRAPDGRRFAVALAALTAGLFLQAFLGAMTAKGANLLWLHVPLGVALVGLAGRAVALAPRASS